MTRAKINVPLEEAISTAGTGIYTYAVIMMAGLVDFAAFSGIQLNSIVIPAASCDLQLTNYQKGVLTSMVYSGMIFSSHMWGFLADTYGRRRVMLVCSFSGIFINLISSLAPNAVVLMASSFVFGLMLSGIFTPIYVYVGECCPENIRAKAMVLVCAMSSLANIYLPSMAWLVLPLDIRLTIPGIGVVFSSWRLYIALLAIPFLFSTFFLCILPETPKFLLGNGEQKETMRILRKIYAINQKKNRNDFPIESVVLDRCDSMPGNEKPKGKNAFVSFCSTIVTQTAKIFKPPFLKYTAVCCVLNIGVVGVFNTVILWFPETVNRLINYSSGHAFADVKICDVMSDGAIVVNPDDANPCKIKDDVFIINVINGLLQVVSYCVFSFIAGKFKKKTLLVWISMLTTVSCAMVIFANKVFLIIMSLGAISICLLVIFPVYITVVVEYFPTSLRTNASSLIMLCGRVSSVAGTQILALLYDSNCELAYPGITALFACITLLFIMLPMKRDV